eukprot:228781_1
MDNLLNIDKTQSGYNIELFIDSESANKYLCSICHNVVLDCHETICGHIFCGTCINRIILNEENEFKCPCCNQINVEKPHQSIYLNRAVKNLQVKCPYKINGCVWIGVLSDLINNHLIKCNFSLIICDECNNKICRSEFEIHKQKCLKICVNCNIMFKSVTDRKLHYQKCPILIQCKFCKKKIKKTELNNHISFLCSSRLIKCPFYHFGCNEILKSLNLTNHLKYNSTQHYQLKVDHCINKIEKMKMQIDSLIKVNEKLSKKVYSSTQIPHESTNQCPDILFLLGTNKWEESGIFIRRSKLHQNRVCYTSLKTKCAIRWNLQLNAWLIDRRGLSVDNEASLIAYQDVLHPGLITNNWLVYNDDKQQWQESQNYNIKSYNLAEFIFKTDQVFSYSNHNHNSNINNMNSNSNPNSNSNSNPNTPPGLVHNIETEK